MPAQQPTFYLAAFTTLSACSVAIVSLLTYRFAANTEVAQPLAPTEIPWTISCQLGQECKLQEDNEDEVTADPFFAWDLDDDSLMSGLFPDLDRLQDSWEAHPLLSKVWFDHSRPHPPPDAIPTIHHNRTTLMYGDYGNMTGKDDPLLSLFSVDDSLEVLSHITDKYNDAYEIVKKVVVNGEEFGYSPPIGHYSISQITQYFHQEGFSVVINDMERKWKAVNRFSRQIMKEVDAMQMNVNLYLTPQVSSDEESIKRNGEVRQGFDPHWDNMDAIIIQLAGKKRWSVAREPIVYLSNRDKQRKATPAEIDYYARSNKFRDFTMCPGDVLLIPRGFMHNASTIAFDDLKRKWQGYDDCPSYPEDVPEAASLASRVNMPSLHLTFGTGSDVTMEALIHHAMIVYFRSSGALKHSVAIPANTCSGNNIGWNSILHHSLAEVARREIDCDNPSFRGIDVKHPRECSGILRQSVPLLLLADNGFAERGLNGATRADSRLMNLEQAYIGALDQVRFSASIFKTAEFIESHLLPLASSDNAGSFGYPGYRPKDSISCPGQLRILPDADFVSRLEDFLRHAEGHFMDALTSVHDLGRKQQDMDRRRQKVELESVGQGGWL